MALTSWMSKGDGGSMTDPQARAARPERPAAPREISSEALFQGKNELVILHNAQRYQLRITSNDKLILTR